MFSARLGEPYISTRGGAARRREGEAAGGLGLGLFIAKALLERSGALLEIANAPPLANGRRGDNRLAARRLRTGSTVASTSARKL